jgi:hypothetical protein
MPEPRKENPRRQPGANENALQGTIRSYDVSFASIASFVFTPLVLVSASSDPHGISRALCRASHGWVIVPAMALYDLRELMQAAADHGIILDELMAIRMIKRWRGELAKLPTMRHMLAAFIFAVNEQRGGV